MLVQVVLDGFAIAPFDFGELPGVRWFPQE
jgi:hypothetical protein